MSDILFLWSEHDRNGREKKRQLAYAVINKRANKNTYFKNNSYDCSVCDQCCGKPEMELKWLTRKENVGVVNRSSNKMLLYGPSVKRSQLSYAGQRGYYAAKIRQSTNRKRPRATATSAVTAAQVTRSWKKRLRNRSLDAGEDKKKRLECSTTPFPPSVCPLSHYFRDNQYYNVFFHHSIDEQPLCSFPYLWRMRHARIACSTPFLLYWLLLSPASQIVSLDVT